MNVDLKEFLDKDKRVIFSGIKNDKIREDLININKLGLFFWERGGKQFVLWCRTVYWNPKDKKKHYPTISFMVEEAKSPIISKNKIGRMSQDFLDCVACLGEEKVKELIKECEKINEFV